MFNVVMEAPFGRVGIRSDALFVHEIVCLPGATPLSGPDNPLARRAASQIRAYFERADTVFDLPLSLAGTAFQRRVWDGIRRIAPGTVWTYGQLAASIGGVPRAVGQACGSNPAPLAVPCHRVVAANGLGGFAHHAGEGFFREVKRWLLRHEGISAPQQGELYA